MLKTHGHLTRHQVIVLHLWEVGDWVPAHELIKLSTSAGITGSAGDVRARELARNDCPLELQGKVESKEGRDIGKDSRYVYFRYKKPQIDYWNNAARLKEFDNA